MPCPLSSARALEDAVFSWLLSDESAASLENPEGLGLAPLGSHLLLACLCCSTQGDSLSCGFVLCEHTGALLSSPGCAQR